MTEKKPYRSALRSRHLIREAFLSLLPEKNPEKITVSDIVRRANINRSTFYAHYPDVQGIVEEIQSEIFETHSQWRRSPTPQVCLPCIFSILDAHKALFRHSESQSYISLRLVSHLQTIVAEMVRCCGADFSSLSTPFLLGGILNLYHSRSDGTIACTPEEISAYIASLLLNP